MQTRTLSVLAMAAVLGAGGAADAKMDSCTQTSHAARRACAHEVLESFWIAIGLCSNTADTAARKACRRAANEERREAAGECGSQLEARQELCATLGPAAYTPAIDAGRYLSPLQTAAAPNPYFPLVPGTKWVYAAGTETTTVTVTERTRVIQGVTCIVVRDVVEESGQVVEDTDDYFAQDVEGTVWYFGEIAKNFENGELADIGGSWNAGVDGAQAGTLMRAAPMVGDVYRQEFALANAEDAGEVLSVTASATVPATSCTNACVLTRDFTPLEPDAEEEKYYAPGVGLILEVDLETGQRNELVSFTLG
jgi:hypothetical protein